MVLMALFVVAGAAPVAAGATLVATGIGWVLGKRVDKRRLARAARLANGERDTAAALGGPPPNWDERVRAFALFSGIDDPFVSYDIGGQTFLVTEKQVAALEEALLEESEDALHALVGKIVTQQPCAAA